MLDNLTTVDVNVNLKYPCKQHKGVENYLVATFKCALLFTIRYTEDDQGLKFNSLDCGMNRQQWMANNQIYNKNKGDRCGTGINGV
jgi:hypothetical protein